MNARLAVRLLREPKLVTVAVPKVPVRLTPIAWGMRDPTTARAVMQNIVDTTPGIHIPWNLRDAKTRRLLHSHRVGVS